MVLLLLIDDNVCCAECLKNFFIGDRDFVMFMYSYNTLGLLISFISFSNNGMFVYKDGTDISCWYSKYHIINKYVLERTECVVVQTKKGLE